MGIIVLGLILKLLYKPHYAIRPCVHTPKFLLVYHSCSGRLFTCLHFVILFIAEWNWV